MVWINEQISCCLSSGLGGGGGGGDEDVGTAGLVLSTVLKHQDDSWGEVLRSKKIKIIIKMGGFVKINTYISHLFYGVLFYFICIIFKATMISHILSDTFLPIYPNSNSKNNKRTSF